MDFTTIRQTNLTNFEGNDMGKVSKGVTYSISLIVDKNIKGIMRRLVATNRYIPVADIEPVTEPPSPVFEKQVAIIQTWNGVEYVTTETWVRVE
jgi:hypothetical protein